MQKHKPIIIFFRGPPAVGKTTIAKHVSLLMGDTVVINLDWIHEMLPGPRVQAREFLLERLPEFIRIFIVNGWDIIVDDLGIYSQYMQNALNQLDGLYSKSLIIELRAPFATLLQRNVARKSRFVPIEDIKILWDELEKRSCIGCSVVNTDNKTLEECADEVAMLVRSVKNV